MKHLLVVPLGALGCTAPQESGELASSRQGVQLLPGVHYIESGGEVVIEAEDYTLNTPAGGQEWTSVSDGTASEGEGMTTPDLGVAGPPEDLLPQLDYDVDFQTVGTYNVWVRGHALAGATGSSNSVHVGLNGTYTTSDVMSGFAQNWTWLSSTMDGPSSTVEVTATGVQTVNVKMREDGFSIDKLYLTTASVPTPTGMGPDVSELSSAGFIEQGGFVVFEAENYVGQSSGSGDTWTLTSEGSAAGGEALQALPDDGTALSSTATVSSGARLDFPVTFSQAGDYRVWVRGRANVGARTSSNSVHVGIDNSVPASSASMGNFPTAYSWVGKQITGAVATMNVPTTGAHTIHVYVREDGFVADKVVLVLQGIDYTPTDTGPAETPATGDLCSDGTLNGDETDTDCGGTVCGTCADGDDCLLDTDCTSGQCDPDLYVCVPDMGCSNGVQDGDEGGVDCDGSCNACATEDEPFREAGGAIVMEAENAAALISTVGEAEWVVTANAGASGGAVLLASPDAGRAYDRATFVTARADFPVWFESTGTFTVFVRGAAAPDPDRTSSNSVNVGLDGVLLDTSDRVHPFPSTFAWRSSTADGPVATIDVTTTGLHAINVWIREDGLSFDKIMIAQGSTPGTGAGPDESDRGWCPTGYAGDPCMDIDECTLGTDECDANAACTNTDGGYTCECNPGYTGDGFTCTESLVDECTLGTDNCDDNATCTDLPDGFSCECNSGYEGDGVTCTLILVDECTLGTDNCDDNATCTDLPVGFLCTCNSGYEGDGVTCVENCTLLGTCVCGDGSTDGAEVCDDGNTTAGDGCRADCRGLEICGDGLIDAITGEECDDGNLEDGDGCSSTCTLDPYEDQPPQSVNSTLVGLGYTCSLARSNTGRKVGVDQLGRLYLILNCDGEIYATSSTNQGFSWSEPVSTGLTDVYEAAIEGGATGFAYVAATTNSGDLMLSRTLDSGATWETPSLVTTGVGYDEVSIDAQGDSVYVAVGDGSSIYLYRNYSLGIGSFDLTTVSISNVYHDIIVDKITGQVIIVTDTPEFHIRVSSDLGVTFGTEYNPLGQAYYSDWTGSNGDIYVVGEGLDVDVIPVSDPGTSTQAPGLQQAVSEMRSIDSDALGNIYVATQLAADNSILLDRLLSGAASVDALDQRVIMAAGANPAVAALPSNNGAVVAFNDATGLVWVAIEVY